MRSFAPVLFLVLLALTFAACGGGDGDGEPAGDGGGQALQLAADPGGALEFDKSELTATAGEVTIELTNESGVEHDVRIEEIDAGTDVITEGSDSVTVTLEPGTYTFYCSVDGHREAGMEGTLAVE